jgi:hypothetical protein
MPRHFSKSGKRTSQETVPPAWNLTASEPAEEPEYVEPDVVDNDGGYLDFDEKSVASTDSLESVSVQQPAQAAISSVEVNLRDDLNKTSVRHSLAAMLSGLSADKGQIDLETFFKHVAAHEARSSLHLTREEQDFVNIHALLVEAETSGLAAEDLKKLLLELQRIGLEVSVPAKLQHLAPPTLDDSPVPPRSTQNPVYAAVTETDVDDWEDDGLYGNQANGMLISAPDDDVYAIPDDYFELSVNQKKPIEQSSRSEYEEVDNQPLYDLGDQGNDAGYGFGDTIYDVASSGDTASQAGQEPEPLYDVGTADNTPVAPPRSLSFTVPDESNTEGDDYLIPSSNTSGDDSGLHTDEAGELYDLPESQCKQLNTPQALQGGDFYLVPAKVAAKDMYRIELIAGSNLNKTEQAKVSGVILALRELHLGQAHWVKRHPVLLAGLGFVGLAGLVAIADVAEDGQFDLFGALGSSEQQTALQAYCGVAFGVVAPLITQVANTLSMAPSGLLQTYESLLNATQTNVTSYNPDGVLDELKQCDAAVATSLGVQAPLDKGLSDLVFDPEIDFFYDAASSTIDSYPQGTRMALSNLIDLSVSGGDIQTYHLFNFENAALFFKGQRVTLSDGDEVVISSDEFAEYKIGGKGKIFLGDVSFDVQVTAVSTQDHVTTVLSHVETFGFKLEAVPTTKAQTTVTTSTTTAEPTTTTTSTTSTTEAPTTTTTTSTATAELTTTITSMTSTTEVPTTTTTSTTTAEPTTTTTSTATVEPTTTTTSTTSTTEVPTTTTTFTTTAEPTTTTTSTTSTTEAPTTTTTFTTTAEPTTTTTSTTSTTEAPTTTTTFTTTAEPTTTTTTSTTVEPNIESVPVPVSASISPVIGDGCTSADDCVVGAEYTQTITQTYNNPVTGELYDKFRISGIPSNVEISCLKDGITVTPSSGAIECSSVDGKKLIYDVRSNAEQTVNLNVAVDVRKEVSAALRELVATSDFTLLAKCVLSDCNVSCEEAEAQRLCECEWNNLNPYAYTRAIYGCKFFDTGRCQPTEFSEFDQCLNT